MPRSEGYAAAEGFAAAEMTLHPRGMPPGRANLLPRCCRPLLSPAAAASSTGAAVAACAAAADAATAAAVLLLLLSDVRSSMALTSARAGRRTIQLS